MRIVDALFEKRVPRGFPYFDLLDRIHQHVLPRTYVEIGVSTGRSLTLALPGTMSVGIDPDPRLLCFPSGGELEYSIKRAMISSQVMT